MIFVEENAMHLIGNPFVADYSECIDNMTPLLKCPVVIFGKGNFD
jgi:hypothetical protein